MTYVRHLVYICLMKESDGFRYIATAYIVYEFDLSEELRGFSELFY